jgi:hypothetical protein
VASDGFGKTGNIEHSTFNIQYRIKGEPASAARRRATTWRLQAMQSYEQALVLARFAQARASDRQFAPKQLEMLFFEFALPYPGKISNLIAKLKSEDLLTKSARNRLWQMTPLGRQTSIELLSEMDLASVTAESALSSSVLGQVAHTVVPPTLAPPDLILAPPHPACGHLPPQSGEGIILRDVFPGYSLLASRLEPQTLG